MSEGIWLNRRAFLKGAGATALAGAATSGTSLLHPASAAAAAVQDGSGRFDFDTPVRPDRHGLRQVGHHHRAGTARRTSRSRWASPTWTSSAPRPSPRP